MKRALAAVILFLLVAPVLAGCGEEKAATLDVFAMDTYMSFTAYGDGAEDALSEAGRAVNELEQLFSRTRENSEIGTLNRDGTARLSRDTVELLEQALLYAQETDGAFDITVAPLVELWGITTDVPRVPAQEEIDALLPLMGGEHISFSCSDPLLSSFDTATLDPGCAVDPGGIAKGYAADRVAEIFVRYDIASAAVSLGGNVYVRGTRPDGSLWRVAIQDPRGDGYAGTMLLHDTCAVTSGGYQRFFTAGDGTVYQHILDPATGYPAQSDLLSVTVVCDSGARADAYSTALYVMGEADAIAFWESRQSGREPFDMVLITADGRIVCTPGLADSFIQQEGTSYACEILNRSIPAHARGRAGRRSRDRAGPDRGRRFLRRRRPRRRCHRSGERRRGDRGPRPLVAV